MSLPNLPHQGDTFTGRIAAYFIDHPNVWVPAQRLQRVGGLCAVSEYRYTPDTSHPRAA